MKAKRFGVLWAAVVFTAALCSCSTPQTRIKGNPEAFARLNPDQQAMVTRGQVSVGMGPDAVKIALGDPDLVTLRTNSAGQTQIWHYVEYDYTTGAYYWGGGWGGGRAGGWGRGRGGWGGGYGGWGAYDFGPPMIAHAHDRYLVEFRSGTVYAITQQL